MGWPSFSTSSSRNLNPTRMKLREASLCVQQTPLLKSPRPLETTFGTSRPRGSKFSRTPNPYSPSYTGSGSTTCNGSPVTLWQVSLAPIPGLHHTLLTRSRYHYRCRRCPSRYGLCLACKSRAPVRAVLVLYGRLGLLVLCYFEGYYNRGKYPVALLGRKKKKRKTH